MMSAIMTVQGWILTFLNSIVNNYGIAIILFTVVVKLLLLPLDLKQKRSMIKTQKIQPLLNDVQKKYANDKERLSQETMKLYQKYGISPMSGCLPMLIQLPIIFALFYVVRKPLIYMAGVGFDETWIIAKAYNNWFVQIKDIPEIFNQLPEVLRNAGELTVEGNNTFGLYEIQVTEVLANTNLSHLSNIYGITPILQDPIFQLASFETSSLIIDFNFIGMNLAEEPSFSAIIGLFSGNVPEVSTMLLWLIPAASGASAFASSRLNSPKQPKRDKNIILAENEKPQEKAGSEAMSSMTKIMPIFSVVFAFTLPAGVGLYWTASNLIQIGQTFLVKKYVKTDITLEEIEGERNNAKNRKKRKKSR